MGKISRILPFSCVDGPGNRLVIFFQGCNFNCLNCHNPHTINHCNHCGDCVPHCPSGALSVQQNTVIWNAQACTQCDRCIDSCPHQSSPKILDYSVEALIALIHKQRLFLNGITLSGGEASLQLPFIIELLQAVKKDAELRHLTCFIDSNGSLSPNGWQKLMPWIDGAMIDVKAWQQHTHRWLVGRENHRVINSLHLLAAANKLYEIRLLHIPNYSDLDLELEAIIGLLNQMPASSYVRLNGFLNHGVKGQAHDWPPCTTAQLRQFAASLQPHIKQQIISSRF